MGVKIGIVVFDGIIPFHLSVPCAVFEKAVTSGGDALCSLTICATQPGTLNTNAGFAIVVENGLDALGDMDMIIVPSWDTPQHIPEPELVAALQRAHTAGALVVGLCMGAFVVAAAGLLAGRQATTHWRWAADFQRRYPNVRVDHDVLYIDEGDVITSAGTAASIDCCLHVVRRLWGAEIATTVARQLVVPPHRQGGQAQYAEHPVQNTRQGDSFSRTLAWASENLQLPLTLDGVAEKAGMSRRSFSRRFRQNTGSSFAVWLLNQRIILAQRFLEKTDQPIELIAGEVGLPSTTSLRRHFQKQFSTSPSRYRREFRGR
ncbi:GlxA family transcriptional regulator [Yokenella regensburgei]|uniref:GlxA family transcriptional regulator n=1 Tax=Yokenella regensburgei TaxID=158877 RepID=UPI0035ADCCCC